MPANRLKRKKHSIYLVMFYLVSFFLVALPFGVIIFARRVKSRFMDPSLPPSKFGKFFDMFEIVLSPALLLYFYMSPLLSQLFLQGFSFPFDICCLTNNCREALQTTGTNSGTGDTSMYATCAASDVNECADQKPAANEQNENMINVAGPKCSSPGSKSQSVAGVSNDFKNETFV